MRVYLVAERYVTVGLAGISFREALLFFFLFTSALPFAAPFLHCRVFPLRFPFFNPSIRIPPVFLTCSSLFSLAGLARHNSRLHDDSSPRGDVERICKRRDLTVNRHGPKVRPVSSSILGRTGGSRARCCGRQRFVCLRRGGRVLILRVARLLGPLCVLSLFPAVVADQTFHFINLITQSFSVTAAPFPSCVWQETERCARGYRALNLSSRPCAPAVRWR